MTVFSALTSHYRRHPLQLLALAVMILLATMLWTGVHHLTSQARASLDRSEAAVAERLQVVRADGQPVSVADFAYLRREGLCVMPWLEVSGPDTGRVVGIDPLAAACFVTDTGTEAPWQGELNGQPFVDISEAAGRADDQASLSLLIDRSESAEPLPAGYRTAPFSVGPDTGELGESFLLNLDALGVLVLLITALLVRSVYLLGLAQRRDSLALLRRFGVPPGRIRRLLVLELSLLALVCILPGVWLGRLLAAVLGDGFGRALEGLFDAPLYAGQGGGWLVPVGIMLGVVLAACLVDFLGPMLRGLLPHEKGRRWWPPALLGAGLGLSMLVDSLPVLFLGVALVFVAVGLWLPGLVGGLGEAWAGRTRDPLARWRYRELSVLVRRLALPLVALQFAMAMVLAVQALVTTFESTFDRWLDQRLAADFYIEVPPQADIDPAGAWLAERMPEDGGEWHRVIRGTATLAGGTESSDTQVDVLAIAPVGPLLIDWRLLEATGDAWQKLAAGDGLMVNEQLARRQVLDIGQILTVVLAGQTVELPILAIYPDYGRPAGELLLSAATLPTEFPATFRSLSVSPGSLSMDTVTGRLRDIWQQEQLTVRDNRSVQSLATAIFDQTFLLTRAMTLLTLILAATALLLMGWVFFSTRAGYFRLLVVWGMSRGQAARQLTRLSVTLTGLVALLALPLGVWLTWVLVHRINPLAFGWSLPMAVYPGFWLELGVLSLAIGLSIAWLMRRQLQHGISAPSRVNALTGGER